MRTTVAVRKFKDISIVSKLSSLNFNSSVEAERSFASRYPNVVIKPLCSDLDICPNYHAIVCFQSRNSFRLISVANSDRRSNMPNALGYVTFFENAYCESVLASESAQ